LSWPFSTTFEVEIAKPFDRPTSRLSSASDHPYSPNPANRGAFRSLILALTPGSPKTLEIKGESSVVDRESVEIGHLSAANLTAGDERQIIDPEKDRSVFPVQGAGSFVGFPSFYMEPDKTLRFYGLFPFHPAHSPEALLSRDAVPSGPGAVRGSWYFGDVAFAGLWRSWERASMAWKRS
jgi:hypothetical protein